MRPRPDRRGASVLQARNTLLCMHHNSKPDGTLVDRKKFENWNWWPKTIDTLSERVSKSNRRRHPTQPIISVTWLGQAVYQAGIRACGMANRTNCNIASINAVLIVSPPQCTHQTRKPFSVATLRKGKPRLRKQHPSANGNEWSKGK